MRVQFVNLEKLFDPNRVITNHQPLTKEKKFSPDGLFSEEIFGRKNDSEMLSFQCECGKYKGKFLKGFECEKCKTPVKQSESMLEKLAWIDLGENFIINPIFYYEIAKLCGGAKNLNNIISYDKKIDRDGNIIEDDNSKYDNIGLFEFREKFDEIIEHFNKTCKLESKQMIIDIIKKNPDKIFMTKIPVFDISLRPATVTFKDKPIFKFDEINNSYNFIIQLSKMVKRRQKSIDLVVLPNLYNIQCKANIIFNKIIENISGKQGFIRGNVIGNRVNFSARNVITPLPPKFDICDISVPYLTFVETYSFHLTNMLSNLKRISMIEANRIVQEAQSEFNQEVYDLCMELVKKTKYGCLVLGIRNPSIARGSVLCLKIAHVKDDIDDLTTSVHNSILELWGGDYDGDVINLFPIMDNTYKVLFYKIFSPVNMFISNNNGRFNTKLNIDRDQVLGIYQFNTNKKCVKG